MQTHMHRHRRKSAKEIFVVILTLRTTTVQLALLEPFMHNTIAISRMNGDTLLDSGSESHDMDEGHRAATEEAEAGAECKSS